MKKCSFCAKFINPKALKCPYCLSMLADKSYKFRGNKIVLAFGFALLSGIAVWGIENIGVPVFLIIGLAVFLVIIMAFYRPFKIQPAVFISFVTFILIALGLFWQKESFDLRNRPFLKITPMILSVTESSRLMEDNFRLEPLFTGSASLENFGPVPASVKEVLIRMSSDNSKDYSKWIPLGTFVGDKEWRNFDVFPGEKNKEDYNVECFLSIEDINKLLNVDITDIHKRIIDSIKDKAVGEQYHTPQFAKEISSVYGELYSILQIEYSILGNENKPSYCYWVKFKANGKNYTFLESGDKKIISRP